jgi:hypothetical protein
MRIIALVIKKPIIIVTLTLLLACASNDEFKRKEGFLEVPGGKVWYEIVGIGKRGTPLLLLHGGPGFTSDYLRPLEALADERPVIFYDQLGGGRSERPDDTSCGEQNVLSKNSLQYEENLN